MLCVKMLCKMLMVLLVLTTTVYGLPGVCVFEPTGELHFVQSDGDYAKVADFAAGTQYAVIGAGRMLALETDGSLYSVNSNEYGRSLVRTGYGTGAKLYQGSLGAAYVHKANYELFRENVNSGEVGGLYQTNPFADGGNGALFTTQGNFTYVIQLSSYSPRRINWNSPTPIKLYEGANGTAYIHFGTTVMRQYEGQAYGGIYETVGTFYQTAPFVGGGDGSLYAFQDNQVWYVSPTGKSPDSPDLLGVGFGSSSTLLRAGGGVAYLHNSADNGIYRFAGVYGSGSPIATFAQGTTFASGGDGTLYALENGILYNVTESGVSLALGTFSANSTLIGNVGEFPLPVGFLGDLDKNGIVDFVDFAMFADDWAKNSLE